VNAAFTLFLFNILTGMSEVWIRFAQGRSEGSGDALSAGEILG
jgi:hypothetical protein